jgi:hypothetical protein
VLIGKSAQRRKFGVRVETISPLGKLTTIKQCASFNSFLLFRRFCNEIGTFFGTTILHSGRTGITLYEQQVAFVIGTIDMLSCRLATLVALADDF